MPGFHVLKLGGGIDEKFITNANQVNFLPRVPLNMTWRFSRMNSAEKQLVIESRAKVSSWRGGHVTIPTTDRSEVPGFGTRRWVKKSLNVRISHLHITSIMCLKRRMAVLVPHDPL